MMTIGTIIKEFRRQHNLTQAEFAKMTGVSSVAAVSRMENATTYNPAPGTLRGLAYAMGMTTDALIAKAYE